MNPNDTDPGLVEACRHVFNIFNELVKAGFTEAQALKVVGSILVGAINQEQ